MKAFRQARLDFGPSEPRRNLARELGLDIGRRAGALEWPMSKDDEPGPLPAVAVGSGEVFLEPLPLPRKQRAAGAAAAVVGCARIGKRLATVVHPQLLNVIATTE